MANKPVPGKNGDVYVPYDARSGASSVVYFTRDLSAEGLKKIYDRVCAPLTGKVAVKLHTGEAKGPNFLPRTWVRELLDEKLPDSTIVETNTLYVGSRYTTEEHRKTLETNGWTFRPVDIMDENGCTTLPVKGGKWFEEIHVGKTLPDYDSLFVLTHFKGHICGGFGGSAKNIGIGCADGKVGKLEIHSEPGADDSFRHSKEMFMERMTESAKAVVDHFAPHITFINVMRNMSVDCDCMGTEAEPVVMPDVGILASTDILAVDQACIDLVYSLNGARRDLIERIESRHGLRQLSYMKELGMGNVRYTLVDIDNADEEITAADAVKGIDPEWKPDKFNVFFGRNKQK